jgi:DNA (cytosine-5)-methyltransferase 1
VTAYYNEIDPYAAQWLRNLIEAGHIAPGIVDERSVEDVYPSDLRGFKQCHFFAGIGVWSYSLRRAGWGDERPVWTGSCPCQPFSAAGKGAGFDDERHLWPAWHHLIAQCKPGVIFGEQVEGKDGRAWLDLVHADLEASGYACGPVVFPSASVGAPHPRHRLYWVADSEKRRWGKERQNAGGRTQRNSAKGLAAGSVHGGGSGRLAHADGWNPGAEGVQRSGQHGQQPQDHGTGGLADPGAQRHNRGRAVGAEVGAECWRASAARCGNAVANGPARPVNGLWAASDWLACTDGKWRPVEPSTFPLAHGAPARVGRLRAYGNAINAEQARIFIESVMEAA